jgi:L-cysteine S-thiosulfotransferase
VLGAAVLVMATTAAAATAGGDSDGLPRPLTTIAGDAARGQALVADRTKSLCLLCHSGPFPQPQLQGNLATDLRGAGSRWSEAQLRLRIVDSRRIDPQSTMPAMHRVLPEGAGERVGAAWRGLPVLDAQQVEDVVAFLLTLK